MEKDKEMSVLSSCGVIKINTDGYIRSIDTYSCYSSPLDPDYLPKIEKFDLEEYKKYWKLSELDELPDTFDILDLGYWDKEGVYEEPCEEHRRRIKENMNCFIAGKIDKPPKPSIIMSYDDVLGVLHNILVDADPDEFTKMAEDMTGAELEWVCLDEENDVWRYKITAGEDYCGAFDGL